MSADSVDHIPLGDAFNALLLDAQKDVFSALWMASLEPEWTQGRRAQAWIAWDRAANSLRTLALYCEQHRDQLPKVEATDGTSTE